MFFMEHFWDEASKTLMLQVWSRKGRKVVLCPIKPYCFMYGNDGTNLRLATNHEMVKKVEFENTSKLGAWKNFKDSFESDIPFERRIMLDLDMKIEDVPIVYLDIEVYALSQPNVSKDQIMSIALLYDGDGHGDWLYLADYVSDKYHQDDKEQFNTWIKTIPKDVLQKAEFDMINDFRKRMSNIGIVATWNGGESPRDKRSFDIPYIGRRYSILKYELAGNRADLDYTQFTQEALQEFDYELRHCRFFDLYQIDRNETARIGKSRRGGYSLENVSQIVLGKGKVKHSKQIYEMTRFELYEYNFNDCLLIYEIDRELHYLELKIGLAQLTNSLLVSWNYHTQERKDEIRPLILVDQLVLKKARQMGLVMPNRTAWRNDEEEDKVIGGLVLEPVVGLHFGVQNFDINQMYPNLIIHNKISPDQDRILIPAILEELMVLRRKYKSVYEEKKHLKQEWLMDYIKQYNYKVLANVFYGAFGNRASRIYDVDLANAVTAGGRDLLQKTVDTASGFGYKTLYGDTDSGFVKMVTTRDCLGYCVARAKVEILQNALNRIIAPFTLGKGDFYDSILFLGKGEKGTKKRYAGLTSDGDIEIRGLENVRRDYCSLARKVQKDVLKMVLEGKTFNYIKTQYLDQVKVDMYNGKVDNQLIVTKGVKDLSDYHFGIRKDGTAHKGQPHIRAYKKFLAFGGSPRYDISFVYTTQDTEPVGEGMIIPKNIDYDLYWEKQILSPLRAIFISAFGVDVQAKIVKPRKRVEKKLMSIQQVLELNHKI